jgi:NAD(P)-dependent dehydrogenase (short-subunit alcohol dehydrogenase family)
MVDWRGRRAWIVGASSGIGLAIAHALHAGGARVVVSARNADGLAQFAMTHERAVALPLDVTDPARVRAAAESVLSLGPLDLVVYCAGTYSPASAAHFSLEQMLQHLDVNYVGALHLLDATLPALRRQGHGHLSLVASVAGYRALPRSLAYGPTKAAMIHLAEALHLELGEGGIGVSVVNPGFVATPLTAQNEFHMPALITPEQAAAATLEGWRRGRFEIHYPGRFTWPMKLLALLPFPLYRRLVLRSTRA